MYTIKQAAARSGVPVQLLRAWERRYEVVEPERTASGYRLYDEAAIARLRAMRGLINDGWAASTAAKRIRELDDVQITDLLGAVSGEPGTHHAADAESLAEEFVAAAADMDDRRVEGVLDEMFARGSFEQVVAELVMPALVALGEGWQAGRVDVAGEHSAAAAVQRRLGMSFMAAGWPGWGDETVLVGMPPGGRHELGALAFATAVRRSGMDVRYLGADLPVQDWLEAVRRTSPSAVVIGAVIGPDAGGASDVARVLRAAFPDLLIAFGGRASAAIDVDALAPALRLPEGIEPALETLRTEIASLG